MSPQTPIFVDRWIGILTFWQVIDLACVGDHAYYEVTMEVTMPLLPYPWITCLLQDMTALAKGTPLCVLLFAVVFVCSVLGVTK